VFPKHRLPAYAGDTSISVRQIQQALYRAQIFRKVFRVYNFAGCTSPDPCPVLRSAVLPPTCLRDPAFALRGTPCHPRGPPFASLKAPHRAHYARWGPRSRQGSSQERGEIEEAACFGAFALRCHILDYAIQESAEIGMIAERGQHRIEQRHAIVAPSIVVRVL
jgi:hypothetical protein